MYCCFCANLTTIFIFYFNIVDIYNMICRFITFCFVFCFLQTNANAFSLFKKNEKVDNVQQQARFYNENRDINENKVSRKTKNYSKIGFEDYSQKDIWKKVYAGIDINWWLKRLGDSYEKQVSNSSFWRRFENFDVDCKFLN